MTALRSRTFDVLFFFWTVLLGLLTPFVLPFRSACIGLSRQWNRGVVIMAAMVVGIKLHYEGEQHIAKGPAVYAAKHQSALDTFCLWLRLDNPAFVLKKELLSIPIFGWFLARTCPIAIDRSAGKHAIQHIADQARDRLMSGRSVVIFPEGTRKAVGAEPAYKSGGVYALYALGYPLIPVALNTGCVWPRSGFPKTEGHAIISFLPALPQGLEKEELLQQLQASIEVESNRLIAHAKGVADG